MKITLLKKYVLSSIKTVEIVTSGNEIIEIITSGNEIITFGNYTNDKHK